MSGIEEARSALIQTIQLYNEGVSSCSIYGDEIIYGVIFISCLLRAFNDKRPFYDVFIELAACTLCGCVLACVILFLFRASNSPNTICEMTSMAIRRGCAYDRTLIRINPLFEDKDLFARIYQQAGQNEFSACKSAISALKTMAIEYAATRNCTC